MCVDAQVNVCICANVKWSIEGEETVHVYLWMIHEKQSLWTRTYSWACMHTHVIIIHLYHKLWLTCLLHDVWRIHSRSHCSGWTQDSDSNLFKSYWWLTSSKLISRILYWCWLFYFDIKVIWIICPLVCVLHQCHPSCKTGQYQFRCSHHVLLEDLTGPHSAQKQWKISSPCTNMSCMACCTRSGEKEQIGLSSWYHSGENTAEALKDFGTWLVDFTKSERDRQMFLECRHESCLIHFNLCCCEFPCRRNASSSFVLLLNPHLFVALFHCFLLIFYSVPALLSYPFLQPFTLLSILLILLLLSQSSTILSFVSLSPLPTRNTDRIFPQHKKCIFNEQ